jgi:hypothetical protein
MQKVVGSRLVFQASTRPGTLLLVGYSTSASVDALFSYVASTYWKHAPITSLLNLPFIGIQTFLEGALILPDSG